MFIHRYNNEIVPKSGQQIGYAIGLPSQYMLKYLSHHIQLLGKKFLRTYPKILLRTFTVYLAISGILIHNFGDRH